MVKLAISHETASGHDVDRPLRTHRSPASTGHMMGLDGVTFVASLAGEGDMEQQLFRMTLPVRVQVPEHDGRTSWKSE